MGRLLCRLGWHDWRQEAMALYWIGPPGDRICDRCGKWQRWTRPLAMGYDRPWLPMDWNTLREREDVQS